MNKIDMESKNIVNENIQKISELFPNVIVESNDGKTIDFDLLRQELSNDIVEGVKEKYQLTWPGKKEAIVNANTPSKNTLRPLKEKSVNFDNTQNIYIEGDNLEVLKILQESYLNKIKCIYIDPPYNTGNDFIYNDKFKKDIDEELLESGQVDEEGNRMVTNNQSNGRFHSDWLSMMYPRLKLARNLLTDDGVIFISIDINEIDNLRKICDEIFGINNLISYMPRKTVEHMRVLADYELQNLNDYVLMYCKNKMYVNIMKKICGTIEYEYEDEMGKYTIKAFQNSGANGTRKARPNLYYPIYYNKRKNTLSLDDDGESIEILPNKVGNEDGRWLWSKEKFKNDNKFLIYRNNRLHRKSYFLEEEDQNKYQAEKTWLEHFPNRLGAKILSELGLKSYFDYSKPVELIEFLIKLIIKDNDMVLDFFSGSATTAHAVMQLNSEDNGNRKYIMVQLPEKCDENSEAYRNGYKTICDIGEERIRRAGAKIKEETNADIDYGFRVYKVDSTNMKDVYYIPNDLEQGDLLELESNIKEDRTTDDLLTQVILDLGLTLDLNIEEKIIGKNKVYYVAGNSLVACFDDSLDIDIVDKICECEPYKVVFKDSAFKTDNDKINLEERFKKLLPQRANDSGFINIL